LGPDDATSFVADPRCRRSDAAVAPIAVTVIAAPAHAVAG
jgi:hypothetical protein